MANKIKQFRYYNEGNTYTSSNQPARIAGRLVSYHDYVTGNVFADYLPIQKLGIQTIPGTKFYLNQSLEPIYIGNTGIFELDLRESEISTLQFDAGSMKNIHQNDSAYLIVDILYDDMQS